jgi:hypothetical protein
VRRIGKKQNRIHTAPPIVQKALLIAQKHGSYARAARILGISEREVYEWSYLYE